MSRWKNFTTYTHLSIYNLWSHEYPNMKIGIKTIKILVGICAQSMKTFDVSVFLVIQGQM